MALAAAPTYKITPSSIKGQLQSNYVDIYDFTSVYAPSTHEELNYIYGNQSISGMLHLLEAESGFSSDTYIWSEEGRRHTLISAATRSGNVVTVSAGHPFRVGEVVDLFDATKQQIAVISAVTATTFTALPYKNAGWTVGTSAISAFVIGSEFGKGTDGMVGSLETEVSIHKNKPVIEKDKFEVSGSDATNASWIKTKEGYLWYMKSEEDGRLRWEDRMELKMLLAEKAESGSLAGGTGKDGTEGLLSAVRSRGNIFSGLVTSIAEWKTITKRFNAQGKIADYQLYCDADQSFNVDDMLAALNSGFSGGLSYGIFDNKEDMAVNLGFKGFHLGGYNIFKTDSKVMNDPTLLGAVPSAASKLRGVMVPVGSKEIYNGEGSGGEKSKSNFLCLKYKESGGISRKYQTWVSGAIGGTPTDDNDVMRVNRLSEKLIAVIGANNFMLFE